MKKIFEANINRDTELYLQMMDQALLNKLNMILGNFAYIKNEMSIVDSGAGSGALINAIANILDCNYDDINYFATDISLEYLSRQKNNSKVQAVLANSVEQIFANNSIDIKYFSSIFHEIFSFEDGEQSIRKTFKSCFEELKNGGQILIRDFVKPPSQTIYMEVFEEFDKFIKFHKEFRQGNAFDFEIVDIQCGSNTKKLIKLDSEWAYEFYMRKEYTENWDSEIKEKYCYFTDTEIKTELEKVGFTDIKIFKESNDFIIQNWLKDKVNLYIIDASGVLLRQEFPATHMIVSARKLV